MLFYISILGYLLLTILEIRGDIYMQQDITKNVLQLVRKFMKEKEISLSEFARKSDVS